MGFLQHSIKLSAVNKEAKKKKKNLQLLKHMIQLSLSKQGQALSHLSKNALLVKIHTSVMSVQITHTIPKVI